MVEYSRKMSKTRTNYSWYLLLFVLQSWLFAGVKATISFTEEPKGTVVAEGGSVRLNCSATTSIPNIEAIYFWKLDGSFIEGTNKIGILLQSRTLFIHSFKSTHHNGIYQCVAYRPEFGSVISKPAKLQAAYISIQPSSNQTYTAADASYILINSPTIQAKPAAKFLWYYKTGNSYIPVETSSTYLLSNGSLLIPSVKSLYNTEFSLFIEHIALFGSARHALDAKLQVQGSSGKCPNPTISFLQNSRNKIATEGQNVVLECLAVAAKCRKNVLITWLHKGQSIGSSRQLVLKNVQKSGEGSYSCSAKIQNRASSTASFQLTVNEKPKVHVPIPSAIDIKTPQTISYGGVTGFKTVEWYTNGDKITSNTGLFEVGADWKLKVKQLSQSLTGVYQIFFSNDAGITTQTFNLYVDSGFGRKVTGKYGTIIFNETQAQVKLTYSTWMIQVPVLEPIVLTISRPPKCSSDGITSLTVYRGSTAKGLLIGQYCSRGLVTYTKEVQGPFVTLVLVTKYLGSSGFTVHYSIKSLVTTQPPSRTTTLRNTTPPPSTPPPSTPQASTSPMITSTGTPATSTKQTIRSTVGGIKDNKSSSSAPVGAIVGAVLGVLALALIFVGIFCYRRRNTKKPASSVTENSGKTALPHTLENTYTRAYQRPGDDQTLPRFTVHGRSMPDVVPSYSIEDDPSPYEMGCLGPEAQSADNQTYATVGEVIGGNGFPVIANQAYLPARSPKQSLGRRIQSGPGPQYSKSLNPGFSERPAVLPLRDQQSTYDTVGDTVGGTDDYLSPVDIKSLPSPTDSNYSKASSNLSGPQYQVLEMGENVTYESADDVRANMEKLENITRNPSDRSENRYAALDDDEWSSKENSVYEPLTLGRTATSLKDMEDRLKASSQQTGDVSQTRQQDRLGQQKMQADTKSDEDDYCDPYEESMPAVQPRDSDDEYSEPYESSNCTKKPTDDCNDNVYEPLNENVDHKKLQGQHSNKYATLEGNGRNTDAIKSAQPLTIPVDDDDYAEI